MSQTKLHVYCHHGFGLHTRESLVNDLEEEITYLFNEVSIFTNLLPTTIQVLNIHRTCTVIPDNFEQF